MCTILTTDSEPVGPNNDKTNTWLYNTEMKSTSEEIKMVPQKNKMLEKKTINKSMKMNTKMQNRNAVKTNGGMSLPLDIPVNCQLVTTILLILNMYHLNGDNV